MRPTIRTAALAATLALAALAGSGVASAAPPGRGGPAFAPLGFGGPAAAAPGHGGHDWGNLDSLSGDARAQVLSLCPTPQDCGRTDAATGRPVGEDTVQVIVSGSGPDLARTLGPARESFDGAVSVSLSLDNLASLAGNPAINGISLDIPVVPTAGPADGLAASLATLYPQLDGATTAWSAGLTGAGIGVAVIDSGAQDLPDFGGRIVHVQVGDNGSTAAPDTVGHGTFVSGVLGGQSPDGSFVGVAPGVTLYEINVASADGFAYTSDVISALAWVQANSAADNIRVANLSLSETRPSNYTRSPLDAAVEQLWRSGVVVVASAGNLGPDTNYYAPGNDPFAITVGALDPNDTLDTADDVQASFSSYGFTLDGYAKPELLAPGRHVVSTLPPGTTLAGIAPPENTVAPGYVRANGTSFAAPQVAGAAAILLQRDPGLTPDQLKWLLAQSSRVVPDSPGGALDLTQALAYSGPLGVANVGIRAGVAVARSRA